MARTASGSDQIEAAKASLKSAKTADQLRAAQAVLLPLELGLTLEQTADAIGRSVGPHAECARPTALLRRVREKSFHNKTFASLDLLEDYLVEALRVMETQHATVKSIVAWD